MGKSKCSVLDDGRVVFRYTDPQNRVPFEAEIKCPLPSRLHKQRQDILDQHRAWARGFNIPPSEESFQRCADTRLDLLAAYQYYDLPFEAAVIHSRLMTWFFVFDDIMDIDHGLDEDLNSFRSELCRRHLEILAGASPEEVDQRCIRAFSDFLAKVRHLAGKQHFFWYDRMVHHLKEYIQGALWESLIGPTTHKNANTALYLQVRHMAVGVAPCLDLMAIARDVSGGPIADNFFIQRMERLAVNYSIWVNDLAGLGRDMQRGLGNIIVTLRHDHSLTLPEATMMLARMCDAELAAFIEVELQLPMLLGNVYRANRSIYEAYIDVLKRWMRGLLDWSARSDRYQRLDVDMALQNDKLIRRASQNNQV